MIKITWVLFFIALVIGLLIILKAFLIPFSYGVLIALIVYPICKKLENKKVPRMIAVLFSVFLVMFLLGGIIFSLILQIDIIGNELPQLVFSLNQFLEDIQKWISINLGLSVMEQSRLFIDMEKSITSNMDNIIKGSFSIAADAIFNIIIIPIYSVLILLNRSILVDFVSSLLSEKYKNIFPHILSESIQMFFNYLKGMLWVYIIVGILNSIGLLILGVDYAILFGMLTAFMTIIPYFGIMVSSILPITMVWIETHNVLYPIGVMLVLSFVQYLEANIIFPYIVGKQLGVNTLISITSVFIGGVIWGIAGMVLFLPFAALLKIISGHIDVLKPINKLFEIPK